MLFKTKSLNLKTLLPNHCAGAGRGGSTAKRTLAEQQDRGGRAGGYSAITVRAGGKQTGREPFVSY